MKDILPEVDAWRAAGSQVALATVVKVEGSAPRPVGATMAVSSAGDLAGSVSGGCVETAVFEEAQLRGGLGHIVSASRSGRDVTMATAMHRVGNDFQHRAHR